MKKEDVEKLHDAIQRHENKDWFTALFHAAAEEVEDFHMALEIAEEQYKKTPPPKDE